MALKTFNVEEAVYKKFSEFCKGNGISMSKQIDFFMRSVVERNPKAKKEYLEKLNQIRKQATIPVGTIGDFKKRYNVQ